MSNFSYVRAGASCVPFVGPFIGVCNIVQVAEEGSSTLTDLAETTKIHVLGAEGQLAALTGNTQGVDTAIKELEDQATRIRDESVSKIQRGRLYAICGIAGTVLSVAATVGLIAFGIFSMPVGVILISSYTFLSFALSYYSHEQLANMTTIQKTYQDAIKSPL